MKYFTTLADGQNMRFEVAQIVIDNYTAEKVVGKGEGEGVWSSKGKQMSRKMSTYNGGKQKRSTANLQCQTKRNVWQSQKYMSVLSNVSAMEIKWSSISPLSLNISPMIA